MFQYSCFISVSAKDGMWLHFKFDRLGMAAAVRWDLIGIWASS